MLGVERSIRRCIKLSQRKQYSSFRGLFSGDARFGKTIGGGVPFATPPPIDADLLRLPAQHFLVRKLVDAVTAEFTANARGLHPTERQIRL